MSRTLKDRPYWVRVNDPKSCRKASHDHTVTCREKVGEEPVYRTVPDKDGWHWHEELAYTRSLYRFWHEEVPCTLDVPEVSPNASWRRRPRTVTDEQFNANARNRKNCNYWLVYDNDYVSGKGIKRRTHGTERSKIRTQLHNAVRDNGSWTEPAAWWYSDDYADAGNPWPEDLSWDDVDIRTDSKYARRGWWD